MKDVGHCCMIEEGRLGSLVFYDRKEAELLSVEVGAQAESGGTGRNGMNVDVGMIFCWDDFLSSFVCVCGII